MQYSKNNIHKQVGIQQRRKFANFRGKLKKLFEHKKNTALFLFGNYCSAEKFLRDSAAPS